MDEVVQRFGKEKKLIQCEKQVSSETGSLNVG